MCELQIYAETSLPKPNSLTLRARSNIMITYYYITITIVKWKPDEGRSTEAGSCSIVVPLRNKCTLILTCTRHSRGTSKEISRTGNPPRFTCLLTYLWGIPLRPTSQTDTLTLHMIADDSTRVLSLFCNTYYQDNSRQLFSTFVYFRQSQSQSKYSK